MTSHFLTKLWRRDLADEVAFSTIMTFDALQNVIDFQGDNYERSYVPEAAQKILKRWDDTSSRYKTRESRIYE